MSDKRVLEQKIEDLEKRLTKIEKDIALINHPAGDAYMDKLYQTAKQLVIKQQKASVIFLQRKLLIDFQRAKKLLDKLEKEGIIGPEDGFKPRQVIIGKNK